jgi:hypothetical protein
MSLVPETPFVCPEGCRLLAGRQGWSGRGNGQAAAYPSTRGTQAWGRQPVSLGDK